MDKALIKYNHYFRTFPVKTIDVYRILEAFEVKDHAIAHAIKKLFAAGKRGAKNEKQDIIEAIDSCLRKLQMLVEDGAIDLNDIRIEDFKLILIENEEDRPACKPFKPAKIDSSEHMVELAKNKYIGG